MTSPEYYNVKTKETKSAYIDPSMAPVKIAEGTSNVFQMYFNYALPHFDVAENYLKDHTLQFIDNARVGLAKHPDKIDRLGIATPEDLERIFNYDRPSNQPEDETLEALDYSLITMGMMPYLFVHRYKDFDGNEQIVEFSRNGMLAAPNTLVDTLDRFRELWIETVKIAQQFTKPDINFYNHPEVMRTALFFEAAKIIPLRNPWEEKKDELYNRWNKLASGQ